MLKTNRPSYRAPLAASLENTPLLISEAGLSQLFATIEQLPDTITDPETEAGPPAAELAAGWQWFETAGGYFRLSAEGVAVLSIIGPTVHRGPWYYKLLGWPTYQDLRAQFIAALDSPSVAAIVLEIDSPGGQAAGMLDLARFMLSVRGEKPVTALVNECACSAAYGLACVADQVVAIKGAVAGSIGVLAKHVDRSKALGDAGFTVTTLKAGEHKDDGNPDKPLDDGARGRMLQHINSIYADFCQLVADARGLTVEQVKATEAEVLTAEAAQAAGLIDGITTYNDFFTQLADEAADQEDGMFRRKPKAQTGAAAAVAGSETQTPETQSAPPAGAEQQLDPGTEGGAEAITMTAEELEAHTGQAIADHMQAHTQHLQEIARMAGESGRPDLAAELMIEGASLEDARARLFNRQAAESQDLDSTLGAESSENPLLADAKARGARAAR